MDTIIWLMVRLMDWTSLGTWIVRWFLAFIVRSGRTTWVCFMDEIGGFKDIRIRVIWTPHSLSCLALRGKCFEKLSFRLRVLKSGKSLKSVECSLTCLWEWYKLKPYFRCDLLLFSNRNRDNFQCKNIFNLIFGLRGHFIKSLKLQTKSASKGLQFWNIRILNVRIYKGL